MNHCWVWELSANWWKSAIELHVSVGGNPLLSCMSVTDVSTWVESNAYCRSRSRKYFRFCVIGYCSRYSYISQCLQRQQWKHGNSTKVLGQNSIRILTLFCTRYSLYLLQWLAVFRGLTLDRDQERKKIWNRTRLRALVHNQHIRELISARNT